MDHDLGCISWQENVNEQPLRIQRMFLGLKIEPFSRLMSLARI